MIVWEAMQIAEKRLEPKGKEVDADTHVILPFTIQFSSVQSLTCVQLLATLWTVAYQAPQSMEFSRQEYWSGLPFPSPGYLPNPVMNPGLQVNSVQICDVLVNTNE